MKTICLDFDGVLHAYTSPWTSAGEISDGPTPMAVDFCRDLIDQGFSIVIHSTRASFHEGVMVIKQWLKEYHFPKEIQISEGEKPPALLYVDDRAFRFNGDFDKVLEFIEKDMTPWNKKGK